ncbi:MAG: prefoldin subunit alpha [Archaeoglobi archaeon]|jgi:prefoldin alpha subunit|nr:prefoldin subunit alpha [Archaeoglobus sp.]TDA27537.1 MAG: prefoldin subunit alpha [Archaeoglobi archaeon]
MSVEEKVAELQQLQREFELLQRRIVELEILANEYRRAISTLEFLKSSEGAVNALISLGGGVFGYVDFRETKKFLVNVGAGIVVEKDAEKTLEFIKKKLEEVEKASSEAASALREVAVQASKIQREIAELSKQEKK